MKQLLTTISCLVLFALAAASCSSNKPKDVAEKAVEAQINGDMGAYYEYLCAADQAAINKEDFIRAYGLPEDLKQIIALLPEARESFKASKFKETITGDDAIVTYVLRVPDADKMVQVSLTDILRLTREGRFTSLNDLPEETKAKIIEDVKKNGVPTKEVPRQMKLVKEEGDQWRVSLDLRNYLENKAMPKGLLIEPMI